MNNQNRILVALDGSEASFETIRYIALVVPPRKWDVHLFHVWDPVPEGFWDFEINPAAGKTQADALNIWRSRLRRNIEEFMTRAKQYLIDHGFDRQQVNIRVQISNRKQSIEKDIAAEARSGKYHCVVLGRRGLSSISDYVMGTVTQRLLSCLTDIPLWIVSTTSGSNRFLIGLDLSEGSMKAVDHVCHTFSYGVPIKSICLFHAIRGIAPERRYITKSFAPVEQRQWVSKATREIQRVKAEISGVMKEARRRLEQAGIPSNIIMDKVVCGARSRAEAIVEYARLEGYGTIVLGRRGLSRIKEFFIGRVSNKVLNMVHSRSVWIVSS